MAASATIDQAKIGNFNFGISPARTADAAMVNSKSYRQFICEKLYRAKVLSIAYASILKQVTIPAGGSRNVQFFH